MIMRFIQQGKTINMPYYAHYFFMLNTAIKPLFIDQQVLQLDNSPPA